MDRCGMVAVVGRANVGKSTLLNRILGEKVSIVSNVAQTTRNVVRAVLNGNRGQLVFLDTPGVHKARHDLGRIMNRVARSAVEGADVALLIADASRRPREEDEGWMRKLAGMDLAVVIACNKIDQGSEFEPAYRRLWDAARAASAESSRDARWVRLSALTGEGIPELCDLLFDLVPEGPHLFPNDILTDFPLRWTLADAIREKLFGVLREELPHAVAVRIESVDDSSDGGWLIRADVLVDKPSQKGIVLGKKGRILRAVRRQAEASLAEMYDKPVELELWVRVEKNWSKNHWILKQLGYV